MPKQNASPRPFARLVRNQLESPRTVSRANLMVMYMLWKVEFLFNSRKKGCPRARFWVSLPLLFGALGGAFILSPMVAPMAALAGAPGDASGDRTVGDRSVGDRSVGDRSVRNDISLTGDDPYSWLDATPVDCQRVDLGMRARFPGLRPAALEHPLREEFRHISSETCTPRFQSCGFSWCKASGITGGNGQFSRASLKTPAESSSDGALPVITDRTPSENALRQNERARAAALVEKQILAALADTEHNLLKSPESGRAQRSAPQENAKGEGDRPLTAEPPASIKVGSERGDMPVNPPVNTVAALSVPVVTKPPTEVAKFVPPPYLAALNSGGSRGMNELNALAEKELERIIGDKRSLQKQLISEKSEVEASRGLAWQRVTVPGAVRAMSRLTLGGDRSAPPPGVSHPVRTANGAIGRSITPGLDGGPSGSQAGAPAGAYPGGYTGAQGLMRGRENEDHVAPPMPGYNNQNAFQDDRRDFHKILEDAHSAQRRISLSERSRLGK